MIEISKAKVDIKESENLKRDPRFRKTTPNMRAAFAIVDQLLRAQNISCDRLGLVLATCHGEHITTMEYLKSLAITGRGRPLLFQNSLHHSTIGFVTNQLKITGPSFTVTQTTNLKESAEKVCKSLFNNDQCDHCVIIYVDVPDDMLKELSQTPVQTVSFGQLFKGENQDAIH